MALNQQQEVQELRELVESLRSETRRLGAIVEGMRGPGAVEIPQETHHTSSTSDEPLAEVAADVPSGGAVSDLTQARTSRRTVFKAGAAVAAAAVATPMFAQSAAAADGGNMIIGQSNSSSGGHTRLNMSGTTDLVNQNIMTVTDKLDTSGFPAAIGAYAQGDRVTNGLYAFADSRNDASTNTGHALVVAMRTGARSHILLDPGGGDPNNDSYAHRRGEIRHTFGDLWFCTGTGTPGTWRKLAGPLTSGSVHAISPRRAYDSRFGGGPLAGGGNRIISVANGIDVNTGSSTGTLVPSNATAVMFNIAIVNTVANGFLAVTPGDAVTFSAASINWSANGQILNNGTMSTLDTARQLRVFAGGAGSTDFIIDVTGYLL